LLKSRQCSKRFGCAHAGDQQGELHAPARWRHAQQAIGDWLACGHSLNAAQHFDSSLAAFNFWFLLETFPASASGDRGFAKCNGTPCDDALCAASFPEVRTFCCVDVLKFASALGE